MTLTTIPPGSLTDADLDMDVDAIRASIASHVEYTLGKDESSVTLRDFFFTVARAARDRMIDRWNRTQRRRVHDDPRRIYYLSMEYLPGRLLRDGLLNLGILEETRAALAGLGIDLDAVTDVEPDPGLGNGGLGRLAACFLDSMATLGLPAMGYGIRYEYGIFRQTIVDGAQAEQPDNWLRFANPWEVPRFEPFYTVKFGGRVVQQGGRASWVDTSDVQAMAYDVPVPGYRNDVVNTLRLWSAKATREFDFGDFNEGDYVEAVREKNATEDISRVLYPNDNVAKGRELRLKQEFFFVSASLQDAIARHLRLHESLDNLHEKAVFQLNDTHPAIAVAELMRLLVDEHELDWERAWEITEQSFAYTNHTLLPEALEKWPVWLFERVLPRHLAIIYEINARWLDRIRAARPGDDLLLRTVSLIEEGREKMVRMANLAVAGSFSVNGVSKLHSRLLAERMFPELAQLFPDRFRNKTNGITPRRWLLQCNPGLAKLASEIVGDGWVTDLYKLRGLEKVATDAQFRARWRAVKQANKDALTEIIERQTGVKVDPKSLFDCQVKRMHEYKRQLLDVLHAVALYRDLKQNGTAHRVPRTVLFAGKAAPGYEMAKRIIQLIHGVADVVNRDPETSSHLKVVFLPNYSVSLAERIIPGADLSEQISTAGYEASGTGNMKFSLNGALTIGTLDGANIEILEAVGEENFFVFGLTAEEVVARKKAYDPKRIYQEDTELRGVLDMVAGLTFSGGKPTRFLPIVDSLLNGGDPYMVLADFRSYRATQQQVEALYADPEEWTRKAILNVARMGGFSSDVTIADYARDIWGVPTARR